MAAPRFDPAIRQPPPAPRVRVVYRDPGGVVRGGQLVGVETRPEGLILEVSDGLDTDEVQPQAILKAVTL